MAHMQKFTRGALGGMLGHFERRKKKGKYIEFSNQSIDRTRIHLNYNLHDLGDETALEFVRRRTEELNALKRSDINVMCSWVVTLPESLREAPDEEQRRFFELAYEFNAKRYGKENVISAHVHNDETSPHMHFAFVPAYFDKKKGIYKLSAKNLFSRQELRNYHPDFDKFMQKGFGRDVCVITFSKDANKFTKPKYKPLAELKAENFQKQDENVYLAAIGSDLASEKSSLEQEVICLEQSRNDLKKANEELRGANKELREGNSELSRELSSLQEQTDELKAEREENKVFKKYLEKKNINGVPALEDFEKFKKKLKTTYTDELGGDR